MRVAFAGFGAVAEFGHLPAYRTSDTMSAVAAADTDTTRRARGTECFGHEHVHLSLGELLAREAIEVVDVCTPPASHVPLAIDALERGCHVICEKPLAITRQSFDDVARAAAHHGRTLFPVHNWKHAPILEAVSRLVAGGHVGNVREVSIRTLRPGSCASVTGDWRRDPGMAGGGILFDHGWHAMYLLLHWFGQEPRSVSAHFHRDPVTGIDDEVTAEVAFPTGVGQLFLTWRATDRANTVDLEADAGRVSVDGCVLRIERGGNATDQVFAHSIAEGSHHAAWFTDVLDDFARALSDRRHAERALREAGWCLELIANAYATEGTRARSL
jgi:predicted dehydrogenase